MSDPTADPALTPPTLDAPAGPDPARPVRAGRLATALAGGVAAVAFTVFAAVAVVQGSTGRALRVETRAFPASVTHLVVEGTTDDVFLYGPGETPAAGITFPAPATGAAGGIDLVARLGGTVRLPTLTTVVDGDTVRVSRRCRAFWDCSARFYLRVPAGVRVEVDIPSGDVRAAGLDGPVRLRTAAGDLAVDRPRGDLEATSSAGDVRVVDSRARRVDASSAAGGVFVDADVAPDDVHARSVAGDVEVYLPPDAPPYDTDVHTSAGTRDVSIGREADARRRLSASTVAGDITVAYRDGS